MRRSTKGSFGRPSSVSLPSAKDALVVSRNDAHDVVAGCLDRAIIQISKGETIDPSLWAIVDGVLRSSSGENGKLVCRCYSMYAGLTLN